MKRILIALLFIYLLTLSQMVPAQDIVVMRKRATVSTLNTGLVAAWRLEEASGTRNDSFSTNHLTDNSSVGQAAGKIGNAGQFNSISSRHLSLADNAAMSVADIDFAFGFWIYLDSKTSNQGLIWKGDVTAGDDNASYGVSYNSSADRFRFLVGNNTTSAIVLADAFGSPSTATWYCVFVWHDATANTINIQVNDGTVNSTSWSGGSYDGALSFYLGAIDVTTPILTLDGRLDAVHFWKKVPTSGERTEFYNSGNGKEYPF